MTPSVKTVDNDANISAKNSDKIENGLNDNGHSGASFSGCMWVTSRVFKEGGWKPGYTTNNW